MVKKNNIWFLLSIFWLLLPLYTAQTQQEVPAPTQREDVSKRELAGIEQDLSSEIELNFNNASLQNIVDQIAQLFDLTFIADDIIKAPDITTKPLSDSKISFKTYRSLTKGKAWNLFTIFLELAGYSLTQTSDKRIYRITSTDKANHSSLPTYINTSLDIIPKSDVRMRYVCFLENSTPDQMQPLIDKLKSAKAQVEKFPLLRAVIITDIASNVYTLVQIIRELDKTTSSQVLSVINLKEADAAEVEKLIKDLQKTDDPSSVPWLTNKKESSLYYFSKDVQAIAAPRTNSLILVGPKTGVTRIEQFIITHVDTDLKQRYQPVHVYDLNYVPAKQVADIINSVVQFGKKGSGGDLKSATVGESGGVLGGLKYFGDVFVKAEDQTNRLLIRSSAEDFRHISQIIEQLDKRQLQVAIEVMIVEIDLDRARRWGIQWNTEKNRTVNAQMSGFWGQKVQTQETGTPNTNSNSIIADLISLAKIPSAGTTVLTLGKQSIYAILGMYEEDAQTRIIANPFIVATNKYKGSVAISEQRRAQSELVTGSDVQGINSCEARWEVTITPQINDLGIVNLDIDITLEDYTNAVSGTSAANANKTTKRVQTNTNVANREVIALGGLSRKKYTVAKTMFPILSKIPIIGNLFKNKNQTAETRTLVVFMSPTIIQPSDTTADTYTRNKASDIASMSHFTSERHDRDKTDPIYRWFFKPLDDNVSGDINKFVNRSAPIIQPDASGKSVTQTANVLMQAVAQAEEK